MSQDKPEKDFSAAKMRTLGAVDYNRIHAGNRVLKDDVTITKDFLANYSRKKVTKEDIERALSRKDLDSLRRYSEVYYTKSGIYSRLCRYMAFLFRYDWMVTPVTGWDAKVKDSKVIEGWLRGCKFLENSEFKKVCGDIALKVMRQGCYYGYRLDKADSTHLQELPVGYCRSRYTNDGWPVVEMRMNYFDEAFPDQEYRLKVLKLYPKEIQKAYLAYKRQTLEKDFSSDALGWAVLDPERTVKFNVGNSDIPMFVSVIPHLIDLEKAQDIDNRRMEQQIMKIIIQQFPMGKNDDPIFDIDQMNALHASAVNMLGDAIGVDVLSTLADVNVADMSDKGNISSADQLEKVERTVYNEAGVSQLQFNSNGSVALEKSIINDESSLLGLVYQFQTFANKLLAPLNRNKKLTYRVQMLPTTSYNYKDLAKLYKEQASLGYSKLLPQVALGMTPTSVVMNALFENKTLSLTDLFIPPQSSNTVSSSAANGSTKTNQSDQTVDGNGNVVDKKGEVGSQGGRPEIADEDKSAKTIANKESSN